MSIYSSFLLRCWLNRDGSPAATYAIEHVQSGEQFRAASLAEVIDWIQSNHERLTAASGSAQEDPQ